MNKYELKFEIIKLRERILPSYEIAKQLDVSATYVNRFLKDYYKKTNDPFLREIADRIAQGENITGIAKIYGMRFEELKDTLVGYEKIANGGIRNKAIELREQGYSIGYITRYFGSNVNTSQISAIIKDHYGCMQDPVNIKIAELARQGLNNTEIRKQIHGNLGNSSIARILEVYAPDVLEQRKQAYVDKLRCKKRPFNWSGYANDLYCMYLDGKTLDELSAQEGYQYGGGISGIFIKHIPEYKEQSLKRRAESEYNKIVRSKKIRTSLYRVEHEFNNQCVKTLSSHGFKQIKIKGMILKPDIIVKKNDFILFIELKVTLRTQTFARALGQLSAYTLDNKVNGIKTKGLVCVPDDLKIMYEHADILKRAGFYFCNESDLIASIVKLIPKKQLSLL